MDYRAVADDKIQSEQEECKQNAITRQIKAIQSKERQLAEMEEDIVKMNEEVNEMIGRDASEWANAGYSTSYIYAATPYQSLSWSGDWSR